MAAKKKLVIPGLEAKHLRDAIADARRNPSDYSNQLVVTAAKRAVAAALLGSPYKIRGLPKLTVGPMETATLLGALEDLAAATPDGSDWWKSPAHVVYAVVVAAEAATSGVEAS